MSKANCQRGANDGAGFKKERLVRAASPMQIANRRSSGAWLRRGRRSSKFGQMARSRPLESRSGDRIASIGGRNMRRIFSGVLGIVAFLGSSSFAAAETPIERGKYLVTLGGCG